MNFFLSFISGGNCLDDLKEMIEPIRHHFNGIRAVYHGNESSPEGQYLKSVAGDGKIIFTEWCQRHDHSRNKYLFETGFRRGDVFCQTDLLEHPKSDFLKTVSSILDGNKDISCLYYYGKPFIVRWEESLIYDGNPHEALLGVSQLRYELSKAMPDETKVRQNMRPLKRKDPKGWIDHYLRYYFYPNSNQILHASEHRGPNKLNVDDRFKLRKTFLAVLEHNGLSLDIHGFINYFQGEINDEKKSFLKDKILNDAYRHFILNDSTTVDEHEWNSIKQF